MSRFLIISTPIEGHSLSPLAIMEHLTRDGHEVAWLSGARFAARAEAIGVRHLPYRDHPFGDAAGDPFDAVPELRGRTGLDLLKAAFRDVLVPEARNEVAQLEAVASWFDPDVIVASGPMFGPGLVRERTGIPLATIGDGPLAPSSPDLPPFGPGLRPWPGRIGRLRNRVLHIVTQRVFAEVDRALTDVRVDLGLPPGHDWVFDSFYTSDLHLQGSVPEFEYPMRHLPANVRWVGALRPAVDPAWTPPSWWGDLDGHRPVVHLTQGTIRADVDELARPVIDALASDDVLVVVTTGRADPGALGRLPGNVRATRFVPYEALLSRASVFVTNGGYTGTTLALHHGVPVLQIGNTEEKAAIGARVRYAGVGRSMKQLPRGDRLRLAVDDCLADPLIRAATDRVATAFRRHDGPAEAALLLAGLAAGHVAHSANHEPIGRGR